MVLLMVLLGGYTNREPGLSFQLHAEQPAGGDDAAGTGGDGTDQCADGQGVRRLGGRPDDVVSGGGIVRFHPGHRGEADCPDALRAPRGDGRGRVNVALIRGLKLSSIIATLATYSILWGISLRLRPSPVVNQLDFTDALLTKVGFVPVAFIVIVLVALAADFWLYRSAGGLAARAMGFDEESAKRRGVRVGFLFVRAFFIPPRRRLRRSVVLHGHQCADRRSELRHSLHTDEHLSGRARRCQPAGWPRLFLGAVVGALFVNMIITVLPFLGWSNSYGQITIGVLTLVALSFYQAPELMARIRLGISNFRMAHTSTTTAVDTA